MSAFPNFPVKIVLLPLHTAIHGKRKPPLKLLGYILLAWSGWSWETSLVYQTESFCVYGMDTVPIPEVVWFLLGSCSIFSKPWSSSSCESYPGCSTAGAISFLPRQCSYLCASSNLSQESCNGNAAYLTCWYSSQLVADHPVPKQWHRWVCLLESSLKPLSFFCRLFMDLLAF